MKEVDAIFSEVRKEGRKYLLEPEAKTVCMLYEIPVTKFKVAKNEAEKPFSSQKSLAIQLFLKLSLLIYFTSSTLEESYLT